MSINIAVSSIQAVEMHMETSPKNLTGFGSQSPNVAWKSNISAALQAKEISPPGENSFIVGWAL